ncbi:MAG TPA: hypothetical protein VIZ69_07390 [Thermoanaerobaculia bacterium]
MSIGPHSVGNVLLLASSPTGPATLYAATAALLFSSPDGGETWSALPLAARVSAFAVDPSSPRIVYAGTSFSSGLFDPESGAVFKSVNSGASWTPATAGLRGSVLALVVDPSVPSRIYCGTTDGLFRSGDGGASWRRIGGDVVFGRTTAVTVDRSSPGTAYAAADDGVFRTDDGGDNWAAAGSVQSGLPALSVTALLADGSPPVTLFAGTNGGGVFRSFDRGASWSAANAGLGSSQVFALVSDGGASGALYAGTNAGVFRSTDAGESWRAFNDGLPSPFVIAVACDRRSGFVYASVPGPGVFRRSSAAARFVPFR